MYRMNGRGKIAAVAFSIFIIIIMIPLTSYAADAKILETNVYDGDIYIFVKGISELSSDSVIQIGNTACRTEQISVSAFGQMNPFMRTLILVDNSKSIPEKNHADIQEILKGIISNSGENEQIKIGTFSREAVYLCDYTNNHAILENIINNIFYNDQDTYLSDVLYNAISELKAEDTFACKRIIILSDGADDNFIGYPNDEVRRYIERNQYPIYTIGIYGKKNESQLETMFSFSRAAKTDFFLIDGNTVNEDVINAILTDQTGICIKIAPDESLKDGGNKSILLKLSTTEGAFELVTSVDMPFGNGSVIQPEPEPDTESMKDSEAETASSLPSIKPALASETTDNAKIHKSGDSQGYLWILILLLGVMALLIAVIIILILKRQKKAHLASQPTPPPQPGSPSRPDPSPADDIDTRIKTKQNGEPEKNLWGKNQLVLRNLDNPDIFFKVPIQDVICIGRHSKQDIVLCDDEVSREHCKIFLRGGLMYLERCENKNGTYYDNVLLPVGIETPILSGHTIKMGQYKYSVELIDDIDRR